MRGITVAVSAIAVFSLTPVASVSAAEVSGPTGIWVNDTGRGAIEIKPCGDKLCGSVVWVKSDADAKGCGKQIIGDVVSSGGGRWGSGWIYSPERGRKYNVELTPLRNGTLRVTGYAGLRFLSKTMIWTRAPADLQLCGQIEAKADQPAASSGKSNATTTAAADAKTGVAKSTPKPEAAAEPKVAAALPPKVKAPPAVTSNDAPSTPAPKSEDKASKAEASPAAPSASASKDAAPSQAPEAAQPGEQTASADDGASDLENKLNDLGLGKIFTKTKSGKCKVDLPWVKVTIDCEQ